MASKKTTSFTDRSAGLDDFSLDMNDFMADEGKLTKQEKKRHPIMKVATNMSRGAASHFYSEGFIRQTIARGLPKGYDTAIETGYEIRDNASQLYNTAAQEYRKIEPSIRRAVGRILPKEKNLISKKFTDKLRTYAAAGNTNASNSNPDEDTIREAMAEISGITMQEGAQNRAEDQAKEELQQQIDTRRFNSTLKALASVDARMARVNAFNDQVFSKYQRRSLEIQYRQLFATRDTQKLLGNELGQTRQLLEAIVHNTALPDMYKSKLREKYGAGIRERMTNATQNAAVEFGRNYFGKVRERIGGNIRHVFSGAHSALQGADMGADTLEMMRASGMDVGAESSKQLGAGIMGLLAGMVAQTAQGSFRRTGHIAQHGAKLSRHALNLPDMITKWATSATDTSTLKGKGQQWLKDQFPRKQLNRRIGSTAMLEAGDPGMLTKRFQRSVEEVMPGYLSRILHELKQMRSGESLGDNHRTVYNEHRNEFTSEGTQAKDIDERLFNNKQMQFGRERVKDFVDKLTAGKSISGDTHHAFQKKVMHDLLTGKELDFKHYRTFKGADDHLTPAQQKELREAMKGYAKGSHGKTDQVKLADLSRQWTSMRSTVPDMRGMASALFDMGHGAHLKKHGLIDQHEDGFLFNYKNLIDKSAGAAPDGVQTSPYSREEPEYLMGHSASAMEKLHDVTSDFYRPGRFDHPVIKRSDISSGQLTNASNGQRIHLTRQLLGGVIFPDQRQLLTAKQVENLVTVDGEKLVDFVKRTTVVRKQSKVSSAVGRYVKDFGGRADDFMDKTGAQALNKARKHLRGKMRKGKDWYTKKSQSGAGKVADYDNKMAQAINDIGTSGTHSNSAAHAAASTVRSSIVEAAKSVDGNTKHWRKQLAKKTREAWQVPMKASQHAMDLYKNGQLEPVIHAKALKAGHYFSAQTGKVINDMRDILHGVKDRSGKWVITPEQALETLRTQGGEKYTEVMAHAQAVLDKAKATPAGQAVNNAAGKVSDAARPHVSTLHATAASMAQKATAAASAAAEPTHVPEGEANPLTMVVEAFKEGNLQRLDALLDIVANRSFGGAGDMPQSGKKEGWRERLSKTKFGLFGKMGGGIANGVGRIFGGAGKAYAGYVGAVGAGYRGAIKAVGWAAGLPNEAVRQMNFPTDVYVKGEKEPRLLAILMEKGEYFDLDSGKPVKCPKDIKGAVRTRKGKVKLTAEEISDPGITNRYGKALIGKAIAGALKFGGKVFGAYGSVFSAYGAVFKGVTSLIKKIGSRAHAPADVYVKGEMETPKLRAGGMTAGIYIDRKTKKKINSPSDIQGEVMNVSKDPVVMAITLEDIHTGLVDVKGRPFKTGGSLIGKLGSGALGLGGSLITSYMGVIGSMVRAGGAIASSPFKLIARLMGIGKGGGGMGKHQGEIETKDEQTHHLLEEILHMLDARMPETEHQREGSWQDEFEKRQHARAAAKKKSQQLTGKGNGSFFGKLKNMFHRKKKGDDDGSGMNIDLGTAEKEAKGVKKVGRFGRLMGRAKGFIGKSKLGGKLFRGFTKLAGSGVGKVAGRVLGGGGRILGGLGKTALGVGKLALGMGSVGEVAGGIGGILSGAGSVVAGAASGVAGIAGAAANGLAIAGSAIGSVLSLPVILGVAAVAAAGAAVYYGYKYYSLKKSAPLRKMRMAQYGIDMNKGVWSVDKVQKLEGMLSSHVELQEGKAIINPKGLDDKEILKLFDLAKSWYNPLGWFHKTNTGDLENNKAFFSWLAHRFKPVFLNWMQVMHQVSPKSSVGDADDLSKEQKTTILKQAYSLNPAIYDVADSPFKDDPIVTGRGIVDAAYQEALKAFGDEEKKGKLGNKVAAGAAGATVAAAGAKAAAGGAQVGVTTKQMAAAATAGVGDGAIKAAMTNAGGKGSGGKTSLSAKSGMNFTNTFLGNKVTATMAVRYKTYGLIDMIPERVKALYLIENDVLDKVRYDGHGNASFSEDVSFYFKEFAGYFGVSATDEKAKLRWYSWFAKRFIPTLLQFSTAVKQANKTTDPRDVENYLSPQHLLDVANQTVAATFKGGMSSSSVWSFDDSPFDDQPLNTDAMSVKINIQVLKDAVQKRALAEEQAKITKTQQSIKDAANGKSGPNGSSPQGQGGSTTANAAGVKASFKLPPGLDAGSNAATSYLATGSTSGPIGQTIKQPGNGTGGDINKLPETTGSGLNAIKALLEAAGKMTGVDPSILATFAGIESSYNPSAHASTSSAAGLFQFVGGTWRAMLARYGKKYGIDPNTPATDPRAAALMGAEYIKENQRQLTNSLGRAPSDTELYMAHFLGAGGAISMIKADPSSIAAAVNPSAARSNVPIFYENGSAQSVDSVKKLLNQKVAKFRDKLDDVATATIASAKGDYSAPSTGGNTTTTANGQKGGVQASGLFGGVVGGVSTSSSAMAGLTPPSLGKPSGATPSATSSVTDSDPVSVNRTGMARRAAVADAQAQMLGRDQQFKLGDVNKVLADQLNTQKGILDALKEILTHTGVLPEMANNKVGAGNIASVNTDASGNPVGASRPPKAPTPSAPVSVRATKYG